MTDPLHSHDCGSVRAPWTAEQVTIIKLWQKLGLMHPLTCEYHSDEPLAVRRDGLWCGMPTCSYTQPWVPAVVLGRASPDSVAFREERTDG